MPANPPNVPSPTPPASDTPLYDQLITELLIDPAKASTEAAALAAELRDGLRALHELHSPPTVQMPVITPELLAARPASEPTTDKLTAVTP